MAARKISEGMLKRFRDYAIEEPSYTLTFAVWDLKQRGEPMSVVTVKAANEELLRLGIVKLIEDNGRMGKVYAYDPPKAQPLQQPRNVSRLFPELDESYRVGELRPTGTGDVVPHTRARGASGKPGRDRKRQERGIRVKRARQGT